MSSFVRESLLEPLVFANNGNTVDANATSSLNSPKKKDLPKWWHFFKYRKLTYKDQLNKNWIQKWIHHGRFPFKFLFHAMLIVMCTWLIFLVGNKQGGYAVSATATFCEILLGDFCDTRDYTPGEFYLYSVNDTVDVVQNALQNYQQIPQTFIGRITLERDTHLVVENYRYCEDIYNPDVKNVDTKTVKITYNVDADNLGPLSPGKDVNVFFQCMKAMTLEFYLSQVHLSVDNRPMIFKWTVQISFVNEENAGRLSVKILTQRSPSFKDSPFHYVLQTRVILDILIIFVAMVSQILHWISIFKSIKIFLNVKRRVHRRSTHPNCPSTQQPLTWNSLPLATKMKFFNLWFIIAIIGSLCNILGSFLDIFYIWEQDSVSDSVKVIIGLGTGLAWVYSVSYLEFNKKYTVLIDALVLGMPNVLRFVAGVIPVYIGFALFGFASFSESTLRFGTFGEAVITLFGIQNGDDMQATFRALDSRAIVSRIYFFVFSILSIYTIANIFIAIIGNAYGHSSKKTHNGDDLSSREEQQSKLWTAILKGLDSDSDDDQDGATPRKNKKMSAQMQNPITPDPVNSVNSDPIDIRTDTDSFTNTSTANTPFGDSDVTSAVMHHSMKEVSAVVKDAETKIRGILKNTKSSLKEIEKHHDDEDDEDNEEGERKGNDADDEGENTPMLINDDSAL